MVFLLLMSIAYFVSGHGLSGIMIYPSVFAFGLVAFGFLGMGPVTIAVDSYGPVTDNAQSIYELSLIESIPGIAGEIEKDFGFKPDFEKAKHYLEANDGAGNTFKATAKPVLIGTAVVGATTMIFSLILVIKKCWGLQPEPILNMLNPYTILGLSGRRRGDLLVHRRVHAGGHHRRLPGGRVYQEEHPARCKCQPESGHRKVQRGGEDLHPVRAERHDQHLHRHLLLCAGLCLSLIPQGRQRIRWPCLSPT